MKHKHQKPKCTCKISNTPCNSAFVYEGEKTIAEIPIKYVLALRQGLTWLCAGASLQKLNRDIKRA